ncbi:SLA class II histocompatibility antigen, DQ haplotype D alpha chain-like isoform X2 [Phycodurus eques]|uniref:SLA class II histocompatibility antigen, DQ haplotype D alpha chain-like isoform X2 n=1 Tax=Phycodurus eques TaxID=693459 RepID=UPI002ACE91EF|nr:SLA class II histocompatibility antigen, DQ haplotype D alpha chain-like isoform X2 [Phycodurus eques]
MICCLSVLHKSCILLSCSAETTSEVGTVNGNEVTYVDYTQKKFVFTMPKFIIFDPASVFLHLFSPKSLQRNTRDCRAGLAFAEQNIKYPANIEDPPESVLYPADQLQPGQETNTLICFMDHFFPPDIRVHWSKNGVALSEEGSLRRYYHNEDLTFRTIATLTFTPKEGDVYGCTVEHSALDKPKTIFLEVEFSHPGVGPDVFCGVGLSVALLGVASGVFLGVKGRYATSLL